MIIIFMDSLYTAQHGKMLETSVESPSCTCKPGVDSCDPEEDDMYLFDVSLEQTPVLDPHHEFLAIKDELSKNTLKRFLCEARLGDKPWEGARRYLDTRNELEVYRGTDLISGRIMMEDDQGTIRSKYHLPPRRHFACPFYVRDSRQHLTCLTRVDLRDIKDVKQHLWNSHPLPLYCPTCGETFSTSGICNDHIRSRSCSPRDIPNREGITMQQMQRMAQRAEIWKSEQLQWLSLWAIIFPGVDLPAVIYPSNPTESAICLFRDYWSSDGEKTVSDFLEVKGFRDYKSRDKEHSLTALYFSVLHQVVDDLVQVFECEDYNMATEKTEIRSFCRL